MDQTEKAFQKQDAVFIGSKRLLGKKSSKRALRYWRNVGLSFQTPKEAKEGNFVDKKCPFTGNVSIRGKILKGMVPANIVKECVLLAFILHVTVGLKRAWDRKLKLVGSSGLSVPNLAVTGLVLMDLTHASTSPIGLTSRSAEACGVRRDPHSALMSMLCSIFSVVCFPCV